MAARKKRAAKSSEDSEEEQSRRQRFQAILLADNFTTKLLPLTLERPNVLLPLVNVPMIDYTLAWLESAGLEEVFVFCSTQVIDYLNNSGWYSHKDFTVKTIESPHKSTSAGDALRYIYEQQIDTSQIQDDDFVLVSGGIVSNMPLTQLIQEHRDRKKKDDKAIMTMVITDHQFFIGVNPLTKQLLYYNEDKIFLDTSLMDRNPSVLLCSDMQDCYIDICSLEMLSHFVDNCDYQHLRCDFVEGVLADDITGFKIFTHEISSCYAARIENFRSYDMVSKDIIQRRTFPYVPDMKLSGNCSLKLGRQGSYKASDAIRSPSVHVGDSSVIGHAKKIGTIFYSMMKLAADTPHSSDINLYKNTASIITRWKGLLGFYVKQIDEQIEVISRLEEMCQESAHELGPLFAHIYNILFELMNLTKKHLMMKMT
ncbi:hypothetical protein ARALYDRAFT_477461, partial [Arabidopsis lyrata subsp. lyrata]